MPQYQEDPYSMNGGYQQSQEDEDDDEDVGFGFMPGMMGYPPYDDPEQEQTNAKTYQQLREMKLIEALDRQTALLEQIAQNYQRNRELRIKADLRKLKSKLERLENERLLKDMQYHQVKVANEISNNNNQLIFNHLSTLNFHFHNPLDAQAQLRANPIVLSIASPEDMPQFRPMPVMRPMMRPNLAPIMTQSMPNLGQNPMFMNPFGMKSPLGGRPHFLPPLSGTPFLPPITSGKYSVNFLIEERIDKI